MSDTPNDEQRLVTAAQAGDAAARDALFRGVLPRLAAFVRQRTGPRLRQRVGEDDLVQTICREAVRDLDGFEFRGVHSFERWLQARAAHKIRQKQRFEHAQRRDLERETPEAAPIAHTSTPSRHAMKGEDHRRLRAALAALSDDHRRIIEMVRLSGMSHAEAAAVMGRSEGALRVLLTRAMAALGARLREMET